jgi:hypothetical protein
MDYFIDYANYCDSEVYFPNVGLIPLKRGQHVFGTPQVSAFLRWDRGRTRRKLKILKDIGFLTIETTNRYSIGTVINYDIYQPLNQPNDQPNDQQTTSRRPADDQQTTTPNKDKKDNKVKKVKNTPQKKSFPDSFKLNEKLREYALERSICENKVDELFKSFEDHHIQNGSKKIDWDRAWYTWVRNAPEFSKWACMPDKFSNKTNATIRNLQEWDNEKSFNV